MKWIDGTFEVTINLILIVLLFQLVLLCFLLRPKRDWYLVERQIFFGKEARAASCEEYTGPKLSEGGWTVEHTTAIHATDGVTLSRTDGTRITIEQTVFNDLAAAHQNFEYLRELFADNEDCHRLFLRRVVARSRMGAITLPAQSFSKKDGIVLERTVSLGKKHVNS